MKLYWFGFIASVIGLLACRCNDDELQLDYDIATQNIRYDDNYYNENNYENQAILAQCTINGKCPKEMVEILRKERQEQRAAEAKAKALEVNSQISDLGIDLNNSDDWDAEEDYGNENIDEPNSPGYLLT